MVQTRRSVTLLTTIGFGIAGACLLAGLAQAITARGASDLFGAGVNVIQGAGVLVLVLLTRGVMLVMLGVTDQLMDANVRLMGMMGLTHADEEPARG